MENAVGGRFERQNEKSLRDISKLPPEAILRLPEVIALVGLSRSSIYNMIARDRFPAQQKITTYAAGWRLGAIRQWLADPKGWSATNDNVR